MRPLSFRILSSMLLAFAVLLALSCEKSPPSGLRVVRPLDADQLRPTKGPENIAFSGEATALRATVLGTSIEFSHAGPQPSSGDAQEASLLEAGVPGTL